MKKSLGIYLHIPFCVKKCLYCDFCSFSAPNGELMEKYTRELCARISKAAPFCSDYTVDTVYFGGGTPTLLRVEYFEDIMTALRRSFDISDSAEITAECNPATADLDYLTRLRLTGVNRLSIGLQSTHDEELRALGRIHSFEDFNATYTAARLAGFDNISADLMYGIPNQTVTSFRESLITLAEISPEHISAYGLKIEENTVFYKLRDQLKLPDEDEEYEMYLSMSEILSKYGYEKYEISNFSKSGRQSKHNLRYWHGEEYLGFGVAAHSYFQQERFGNSRDMEEFLRGGSIESERNNLEKKDLKDEYIMLSLRLTEGIDVEKFKTLFGKNIFEFYPAADALIKQGYMRLDNNRLSFTDKGFFVSNTILADMLDYDLD